MGSSGLDLMGVCVVIGMWNVKDDLQRMLESDQTAVLLFVLLAVPLGSLVMNGKKFSSVYRMANWYGKTDGIEGEHMELKLTHVTKQYGTKMR